jgi:NTE family protein
MTARIAAPQPKPLKPEMARRPTIGLALGGGGARGLAHLLMLEVLDEMGVVPVVIAGTSIGALFGACYAAGMPAADIRAHTEDILGRRLALFRQLFAARSTPVQKLLSFVPVRSSLLSPLALLERVLPSRVPDDFEQLAIPFKAIATDLGDRAVAVLERGALKPAVAASIAIPVVFSPMRIGGRTMVDGGLVNPLPFDVITGMADIVIAIDVSGAAGATEVGERPTAIDVLMQSVQIMEKSITREKLARHRPDIYIDVELDTFGALEFYKPKEIFAAAAPAKETLRRQLVRVLGAETVRAIEPPQPEQGRLPLTPRKV